MTPERKYKEPGYEISHKTGKILMCILFVFRVLLVLGCIWGLFVIFGPK